MKTKDIIERFERQHKKVRWDLERAFDGTTKQFWYNFFRKYDNLLTIYNKALNLAEKKWKKIVLEKVDVNVQVIKENDNLKDKISNLEKEKEEMVEWVGKTRSNFRKKHDSKQLNDREYFGRMFVLDILQRELSKKEAKGNVPLASPRRKGRPNIGVCASSRLPARLKKERD